MCSLVNTTNCSFYHWKSSEQPFVFIRIVQPQLRTLPDSTNIQNHGAPSSVEHEELMPKESLLQPQYPIRHRRPPDRIQFYSLGQAPSGWGGYNTDVLDCSAVFQCIHYVFSIMHECIQRNENNGCTQLRNSANGGIGVNVTLNNRCDRSHHWCER